MHKYFQLLFIQFSKLDGGSEDANRYCKSIGLSKAATIVNAIKYLIENNINLAEWIKKGKQTEAENKQTRSGDAENN